MYTFVLVWFIYVMVVLIRLVFHVYIFYDCSCKVCLIKYVYCTVVLIQFVLHACTTAVVIIHRLMYLITLLKCTERTLLRVCPTIPSIMYS